MTKEQVDFFFANLVDNYNITVFCFGLKTDFQLNLFEGSKRLLELADDIDEIVTTCWCGRKAKCNARIYNNKIIKCEEQVQLGGNESYIALCRKHFIQEKLSN